MVLFIVIITLADIIGFLHFWDITIDIISCINLVLAIGLCVDYSVHIGHAFLVARGKLLSVPFDKTDFFLLKVPEVKKLYKP